MVTIDIAGLHHCVGAWIESIEQRDKARILGDTLEIRSGGAWTRTDLEAFADTWTPSNPAAVAAAPVAQLLQRLDALERQVAAPPADPRLTLLRDLDAHYDALVAQRYAPADIAAYDQLTGRLFGIADGSLNPLTPQEREDAMRLAGIGALQAARDRYRAAILAADATPNSIDITLDWPE